MPLPSSGRGSTTSDHQAIHGQQLVDQHPTSMSSSQVAGAGYAPHHAPSPYGRHQQGHVDIGAASTGVQHTADEALFMRSTAPIHPPHLPTVAEEDVLATVGPLEMTTQQEPDLAELAAAAAAVSRGGPSLEVPTEPTRVLLVRNVAADVSDVELQDIFQAFGDLHGLHTSSKGLGVVVVAYYDLRAAMSAQSTLQGTLINKIAIDVQFAPTTLRGKAIEQGQVVVFNLDPDTSNDQLVWLFSKFGEVQGIKQSPTRPNQKFITFYDTRHAAAAMRAMNRAEQLNKIPSYVTPQQMATLQTVTSGPNLVQLAQLQGLEPAGAPGSSSSAGQAGPSGSNAWDGLSNPTATMEGLLQLVQNQQNHAAIVSAGMMGGGGAQDTTFNRLGLDPLATNPRSLPLSDSASSIAGVPHNLLMAAGSQSGGGKSHLPNMPGGGRGMSGMDNSQAAAAAMYNAAAAAAADRQAAAAQQQLQLLQASEAANMLMNLNLGGAMDPSRQQAAAAALWEQQAGKLAGMQDAAAAAAAAGMWPGAASANFLGGANISQLAALQELQLRQQHHQQQQAAAAQQVQALQQAANMNPLTAAANLQAAAQILQAAGLGQLGPSAPFLPNAGYNASAAAQILQQAGLGLPGLGLHLPMAAGGMLGGPAGGGRAGDSSGGGGGGNRSGGRLSRRTTDPVAEAERKAQQEKLYALDLDKIARGEDKRTTLMIKNIPNKYTQKMLLATVDEHFKGTYDFFYLPIDFKNKCNVGYAFINMVLPIHIIPLVQRFNHKKWERFNSEKVCNISYARIQGRAALVQHFQNSSLMHEDKRCRPILFTLDDTGELAGEQEPFPSSASNPGSLGGSEHGRLGHSMGSGMRLSGLAGSSNSLRSQGGSTNSLRELQHKHMSTVPGGQSSQAVHHHHHHHQ